MQNQNGGLEQQPASEAPPAAPPLTAEETERKLVDDINRSGGQAFQFDANASPEEKAAQARAVRVCSLQASRSVLPVWLTRPRECRKASTGRASQ